LDQRSRVTDSGVISLSMIGPVKVAGMTPFDAARVVREKYIAGNYFKDPQVSVLVEDYATENVSVLGQVNKPGGIPLLTPRSVFDVIAMAGGLTPIADRHITVQRKDSTSDRVTVYIPNDSTTTLNETAVLVYPGDKVIVPKAPIVYVLGDVARPGGYPMENDSKMTVIQSIATAGGAAKTASEGKVRLIRRTGDGPNGYTEQSVSVKDMEKGKLADMQLEPNDIVYVPFSWAKNIAVGSSSILASATTAVIYHP
jgi:polysaccharide export outer membrane protein